MKQPKPDKLALELYAPPPNPNAAWFDAAGRPRRLLWCSDDARMGGPCPYTEPRASRAEPGTTLPPIGLEHRPAGGCCKDLARGAAR